MAQVFNINPRINVKFLKTSIENCKLKIERCKEKIRRLPL
jgi:hypothetical protein